MNRDGKVKLVENLHARLEKAQAVFLVDYQGLNVEDLNRLRADLRKAHAEFAVVKNRLLKLASRGTETEAIVDHMKGPSAIALTYDDVIDPAKALVGFVKEFDKLNIKVGQVSGKELDEAGVKYLASLPGKEALIGQALSVMQAVPGSFVRVLNGIVAKLVYALKAIEEQKANS